MRSRFVLGSAVLLAVFTVPVAIAQGSSDAPASASASVKKKVKKLTKRVQALEQRLADQGEGGGGNGATAPPSGPAGGDLTSTYPDPRIASNAVGGADVAPDSLSGADIDESTFSTFPDGPAGGSLAGTYPDPVLGAGVVGESQLIGGAATNGKIGADAVTTEKIANGEVGAPDLGAIVTRSAQVSVPGGGTAQNGNFDTASTSAQCEPGEEVISGGAQWGGFQENEELLLSASYRFSNTWVAVGANDTGTARVLHVYAQCLVP